ncbi:ankyrin repeat domain-containing protein [Neoehrlichia mikurensis]|uniref:Ankyrin repeat domain-containing protein n=1 Tax=Neoehrlichia mikurensis TaxID=89586 RepID=A0A9Q9BTZ1_9RICK|nr:ankyrin repeat domain-containing protein [Neoehrlichia mikurensis]QXK92115.1 ankyrin repeat domain-containing protein [Neoehrlichia mikurensis]QXK92572.1 ankyrin repeat domain-containing protein [Neoehrlichia mikurensis]QXK93809.1 ankyrin repeat domain-containing protein [Neoehrlichia mikurensis]UTO55196.1 ankyrin repeat domain-containing protein [Neoehrlichia mikurensis]UTO56116.1 ankyrin repeat domain-containing protein [Neoehrlichia mikurensis]
MSLDVLIDSLNTRDVGRDINKTRSIYEKIVRACNEDKSLVKKELYIRKVNSDFMFYQDESSIINDIMQEKDISEHVKHSQIFKCSFIHLPFIINTIDCDQLSDFCECLVSHGADINALATESIVVQGKVINEVIGKTPIAYAIANKNIHYVKYLLSLASIDTGCIIKDIYDISQGYNIIIYAIKLFILDHKIGYYALCGDMLKILDVLLDRLAINYDNCDIKLRKYAIQIIKILDNIKDPGFNYLVECLVSEELLKVIELFIIGKRLWKSEIQDTRSKCNSFKRCENNKQALQPTRKKKKHISDACTSNSLTNVMLDYYNTSYNLIFSKYNHDEESLLGIAVFCGKLQLIKYLLEDMGISPNLVNKYGYSLLHIAVVAKDAYDCVSYLLDKGANTSVAEYKFHATPLHIAASQGSLDIVKLILGKNPDAVYQVDIYGQNMLHYAARNANSIEIFRLIKNLNINSQVCGITLDYEYLKKLCGIYNISQSEVQEVLELKDNNFQQVGNTPLHIAVENGNFDVAKFLILERCCDVDIKNKAGYTVLDSYSTCGGNTLLHQAVMKNDVQFVTYLLSYKDLDVNICNLAGSTALKIAIAQKNINMICTLLADERQNLFFGDTKTSYIPLLMFSQLINDKVKKLIIKKSRANLIKYSIISLSICLVKFVFVASAFLYCIFIFRDQLISFFNVKSDSVWKIQVTFGVMISLIVFSMFFCCFIGNVLTFQLSEQNAILPIINQKCSSNGVCNEERNALFKGFYYNSELSSNCGSNGVPKSLSESTIKRCNGQTASSLSRESENTK